MLKAPIFWLLYVMFVLVAGSGLMATAQIAPIALDFRLADHEVTILFVTATTLSSALVFDNVLNGLARPFFGWISDVIGRENTMAIVFSFGALAYWGLSEFGHEPYMFIIMAGFIFFTWGEIFSLFPATCTDTFGARYATTNAGLLYTAKGAAAWVVPPTSLLKNYTGHWYLVFVIATTMNDNESCGCGSCAIHAQADAEKTCLLDDPLTVCRACERRSARAHAVGSDRGEVQSLSLA
jgi:OFA family oxalate/formate antiporter-like MFS transporter